MPCCLFYFSGRLSDSANDFAGCTLTSPAGISWATNNVGLSNSSMSFASGSYAACNRNNLPVGNAPRTTTSWMKCPLTSGSGYGISWGSPQVTNGRYALGVDNSGFLRLTAQSNDVQATTALAKVCDSRWHYVAAAFDGTSLSLYVDNALVESRTPYVLNTVSSDAVFLAFNGYPSFVLGGEYMTVSLFDVRIYSRGLTAAEVISEGLRNITSTSPTASPRASFTP